MANVKNIPSQEDLNNILKRLLEAEIAEESDLPCKAITMRASALLELSKYTDCKLDLDQALILSNQNLYV